MRKEKIRQSLRAEQESVIGNTGDLHKVSGTSSVDLVCFYTHCSHMDAVLRFNKQIQVHNPSPAILTLNTYSIELVCFCKFGGNI